MSKPSPWRACLALILLAGALSAAEVATIVPDLDEYAADERFSVDSGKVVVRRLTDYASRIVLTSDKREVRLRVEGFEPLRVLDLRTGRRIRSASAAADLTIPEDGVGWFVVYDPPAEVSIYEFKPRSPLKLPTTGPKKARYPVVDVHAHLSLRGAEIGERLKVMDAAGVGVVIDNPMAALGQTPAASYEKFEAKRPDRFLTFATVDFTRRHEQNFAEEAIRRLEQDVELFGAVGIGETHDKGAGLFGRALVPEPRGPVYIDDPRVLPLWKAAARLKLPVLMHVADPPLWYRPPDRFNEHLPRMARSPWFIVAGLDVLPVEEILKHRDRVLEQIPDLVVIGAHMGSSTENLGALAETLRKYPNLYPEIGVRHTVLARQPRAARKFFIEFQDRILYGADGVQPLSAYRMQWRIFETGDDSFTPEGGGSDPFFLYGLDLPDTVLKKLYYANAARLMPKVKQRLLELDPKLDFPGP